MGSEDFSLLAPDGVPYDYWSVTSTPAEVWDAAPGEERAQKIDAVPAVTARCSLRTCRWSCRACGRWCPRP